MEALLGEHTTAPALANESDVDILECTVMPDVREGDPDMTECSSSFGGTISGDDNCPGLGDEVESQFKIGNELPSPFDAFSSLFQIRKKRVTNHWRNFIRPIIWRCKWTELKMKEIQSHILKYEAELNVYDKKKQSFSDQCATEGCISKSLPFSNPYYNRKVMKRRNRKRIEDCADVNTHMINHYLFSYFENWRTHPNGVFTSDDLGNPVVREQNSGQGKELDTNGGQFFELREGKDYPDEALWKMEVAQSRVHNLIGRMEALISNMAGKSTSQNQNPVVSPFDCRANSCALTPTLSPEKDDTACVPLLSDSDAEAPFFAGITPPLPVMPTTDTFFHPENQHHPEKVNPLEKEEVGEVGMEPREEATVAGEMEEEGLWVRSRCGGELSMKGKLAADSSSTEEELLGDETFGAAVGGRGRRALRLAGQGPPHPHLFLPTDLAFPNKRKRRGGFRDGRWTKAGKPAS